MADTLFGADGPADRFVVADDGPSTMDVADIAEELRTDDPDLPQAEAAFLEAVEAAKANLDAGAISRAEYHKRVAAASERYRVAADVNR